MGQGRRSRRCPWPRAPRGPTARWRRWQHLQVRRLAGRAAFGAGGRAGGRGLPHRRRGRRVLRGREVGDARGDLRPPGVVRGPMPEHLALVELRGVPGLRVQDQPDHVPAAMQPHDRAFSRRRRSRSRRGRQAGGAGRRRREGRAGSRFDLPHRRAGRGVLRQRDEGDGIAGELSRARAGRAFREVPGAAAQEPGFKLPQALCLPHSRGGRGLLRARDVGHKDRYPRARGLVQGPDDRRHLRRHPALLAARRARRVRRAMHRRRGRRRPGRRRSPGGHDNSGGRAAGCRQPGRQHLGRWRPP
mmetsp:Transcript_90556/g.260904  ORF Transcript_90556/g.260904 Transcript_90556/m.260904 type:complete len:302 (-) Transcript_90556:1133-2038(-)